MLTQSPIATCCPSAAAADARLAHPFRAIVFDWDGTAVAGRQDDAAPLARLLEALMRHGVWIVVVTGTNFGHIDRQLCRIVAPRLRSRLLVCTNRGSEVYGFDERGTVVLRWRRVATPAEEHALTATAEAVRDQLEARTGLPIRIVYDRLNRRKIDLIPEPAWADPPKDRIGELLVAVQARLSQAGLAGGLAEAIALTERCAREHGLRDARITTDVKHIEVGLTDKGDSVVWLRDHLLEPEGIAAEDVLIAGDEFGPLGGFPGSDDRLRHGLPGAVVVSVGAEPNGVPEGVIHLGGGPACFRALLAEQVRLHREIRVRRRPVAAERRTGPSRASLAGWAADVLQPPADPAWALTQPGYEPALEHAVESRLAIGNGLLGVRGSLEEPTRASRPRTYVAGLFDTPEGSFAVRAAAPAPDWLRLRLLVNGVPLSAETDELEGERTLDLRRGLLLSDWCYRAPAGQAVRLRTLRLASLADRALALQVAEVSVDQPTLFGLEAWIEPPDGLQLVRADPTLAVWRTRDGTGCVALAREPCLEVAGARRRPSIVDHAGRRRWEWSAIPGECATFVRVVAVARGEDADAVADAASAALARAQRRGPRRLVAAHTQAWAERWAASDVQVDGDVAAQHALRFAVYHLIAAANPTDERVSIGARALTGDAYLGHVFWDTEIFLLPFYVFTWPAAARALLLYRYHTLPAARAKAARLGYRGAFYAWESADTGEETTPPRVIGPHGQVVEIRCGTEEQHISADVAYAVWLYWQATGDTTFLLEAGAEIMLETARFWASRAVLEADGYHIRGVIGPDEYHEGVDDNAYTNVLAAWNLERGLEVAALLERRWPERSAALRERLTLTDEELRAWRDVAARLAVEQDPASRVFEQFAGYFGLEPIDLAAYEPRTVPMDVLLGRERTQFSQVIKQADVLMLLALLPERFPRAVQEANYRYYEPRTGHGSSLSPAMHGLVAARLGDVESALRYFHQAAAIDFDDTMGNAAQGVHIATQGGLWQTAVLGFAGLGLAADGLSFAPHLPSAWSRLRFAVQWHGRMVRVDVQREPRTLTAILERGRSLAVHLGEQSYRLHRGEPLVAAWDTSLADNTQAGKGAA